MCATHMDVRMGQQIFSLAVSLLDKYLAALPAPQQESATISRLAPAVAYVLAAKFLFTGPVDYQVCRRVFRVAEEVIMVSVHECV